MNASASGPRATPRLRWRLRVEGTVQGVGFRPFVCGLAHEYGLAGFVGNDPAGVFLEVEGPAAALAAFRADLRRRAPALAVVERVRTTRVRVRGDATFRIVASDRGRPSGALVAPDAATCADCLAEVDDPAARRFGYPFTNCASCGPRFTIVRALPYDRATTTMAGFAMCADCAREFGDPADRRFHAQPVCCPACGPTLRLCDARGRPVDDGDPIAAAARRLRAGEIVAVKGIGGYHLAALAGHGPAVSALRGRKRRSDKPFAVLAADLSAVRALVHTEPGATAVLTSVARPIVLLPRRPDAPIADAVAPGSRQLGVMLPYSPLHHLLAAAVAAPIVLTSGNAADEPIAHLDDDALTRLRSIADAFLVHDRPIHARVDDSVVRLFRGRPVPIRRARGYAPAPVPIRPAPRRPVLACGAELKHTFCLAQGSRAFLSAHIGDLTSYPAFDAFRREVERMCRLLGISPAVVAHDLHPDYLSTAYAVERGADAALVAVQHHHAHIASCLADNAEAGPVVGVAFDGLGYGVDGTLWGGELLIADAAGYRRAGHLEAVRLPGGAAAIREPWRMAASYLRACYGDDPPRLPVARRNDRWDHVTAVARAGLNAPSTTSAGRLFDAVAALLDLRDVARYEGQAAIELEQHADAAETSGYPVRLTGDSPLVIRSGDLVRGVVDDLRAGVPSDRIAARFHNGLGDAVTAAVRRLLDTAGLDTAALSGGCFQNVLLLERVTAGLEAAGVRVLTHRRVPSGDGGIALGQAVVAAAVDRGEPSAAAVDRTAAGGDVPLSRSEAADLRPAGR